jgi:pyridoxine 5-phosphate synthase
VGAEAIEIHTGHYCDAKTEAQEDVELKRILDAVAEASHRNLHIAAGHGLNYVNVRRIAEIKEIEELNIGHSIIARAVLVGLDRAVREMIQLIKN